MKTDMYIQYYTKLSYAYAKYKDNPICYMIYILMRNIIKFLIRRDFIKKKRSLIYCILNFLDFYVYIAKLNNEYDFRKNYKITDECSITINTSSNPTKISVTSFTINLSPKFNNMNISFLSHSKPLGDMSQVEIVFQNGKSHLYFTYYGNGTTGEDNSYNDIMNTVESIIRELFGDIIIKYIDDIPNKIK